MMASVQIYIEGGGDSQSGLRQLRLAFQEFFSEFSGRQPKVVACGGRGAAFDDFGTALREAARKDLDTFIILLVDAEAEVNVSSARQHLSQRDGWDLQGIGDDQVHLLVQAIEAWLIADRDALRKHYGADLNENALPGRQPEEIPKNDLKRALKQAGRNTKKKGYHEISDGTKILELLDPAKVRAACPHCRALFAIISRETGIPLPDLQ